MNKSFSLLAVLAVASVPALSHAGFTAATNSFAVSNTSSFNTIGNVFSTTAAGTMVDYSPDGASDPQLGATNLSSYKFDLTGTATVVSGNVVTYTGTYQLYYDLSGGINISSGTASFQALRSSSRLDILAGSLVQTAGPASSSFVDLAKAYNYNPVSISGSFTQKASDPKTGLLQINFEQDAQPVPEPASIAALGVGALGLLKRRKKA